MNRVKPGLGLLLVQDMGKIVKVWMQGHHAFNPLIRLLKKEDEGRVRRVFDGLLLKG